MNCRHLLTVLVGGMILSACAHDHYRTEKLSAGFECAVDDARANPSRPLCERSEFAESHAIQHRYYTGSFKTESIADRVDEGDYYLSFVEFDDQGWFADRGQMETLLALLEDLKNRKRRTLIYVYAHGWKHNASACDDNVVCFSRLLERYDLAEQKVLGSRRAVVGVYLGWRGLPFDGVLNNLSFWTRKDAAARVGSGGVFELLTRLNDYRSVRRKQEQRESRTDLHKTQLIITGHSFGGLVIYSALSHALMERAAKTAADSDGATKYDVAESFGDFVMLVNPAFEGSLYEPLFQIAVNRRYEAGQRPVTMIVTSKADGATKYAFPIGRDLGTLFQRAESPEQQESMRRSVGHNDRYVTHNLTACTPSEEEDSSACGCPHLYPTLEWDQQSLRRLLEAGVDKAFGAKDYGEVSLSRGPIVDEDDKTISPKKSTRTYAPNYPYLVVETDENVIADHNAVYNENFINFAQLFYLFNVASDNSLPGDKGADE